DYVSLIRITGITEQGELSLEGAIFDERHPRLLRINDYAIESTLEGHVLFTRHVDRPGVIGALGELLGREGINISRMQVGIADGGNRAIALIGISQPLSEATLEAVRKIDAVEKALQIDF
ncbi:MAG: ACT domain-containing protein, partial [Gammaproteobacteria bacterium]|nr:ACT domain-containing protein [Gammaproteobacteria bacterium]